MNLNSLLLGHFDSSQPFYLYRIEKSPIILFQLNQVCSFFNLPPPSQLLEYSSEPFYRDKEQHDDIFLTSTALGVLAIKHRKFLLAELCKLKPNDYAATVAESILRNLPRFERNIERLDDAQYQPTHIELVSSSIPVKQEPTSPPPLHSTNSDPMSIDTMLSHGTASKTRRLSRSTLISEEIPNKKQKTITTTTTTTTTTRLPKPLHTVSSQKAPPTLLSKRLGQHNNIRNLTIYAPSYGEQHALSGIKSAPLNSNFRQQQQQQQQNKPHPLSKATLLSPATSTGTSTEFAIPPIVPSQQQPPHTAHPSSTKQFPRHSPQYPSSAYGHSFPVTSGRVALDQHHSLPKTPISTSHGLQRQQFMQPFEHLFETIETTKSLKSTLDDQIRRSSTLLQTLQASSTTIESLVRNQIKEVQKDALQRMEDSIDQLFKRILVLEKQSNIDTMETEIPTRSTSVSTQEYQQMMTTLQQRLDKLEKQLEDA